MPKRPTNNQTLYVKGFGERLRQLRLAYAEHHGDEGHTKIAWANRLGVSAALWGRWETGVHFPIFADLLKIALLFRVDPNYLIAGILDDAIQPWLRRALRAGNPSLILRADYWQHQNELFDLANRAIEEDDLSGSFSLNDPRRASKKSP